MPETRQTVRTTRTRTRSNDLASNLAIFAVTFLLSLGGGYLMFNRPAPAPVTSQTQTTQTQTQTTQTTQTPAADSTAAAPSSTATPAEHTEHTQDMAQEAAPAVNASASVDTTVFTNKGCVGCHSVSALGVQGGATGPDLSKAYVNVPDKHGLPVDEFLQKPTSAVMSSVIGGNPLPEADRKAIVEALKAASEK